MPFPDLTCLSCGRYQGGDPVIRPAPGWTFTGGGLGPMQTCGCCQGTGHHDPNAGVPACHDTKAHLMRLTYLADHDWMPDLPLDTRGTIKAIEAAEQTYNAEETSRVYAALVPLYGPERAETLMEEVPPL